MNVGSLAPSSNTDIATAGKAVAEVDVQIGPRFLNLFSEHLYSSPNKAFEELIANSWDAGAETVYISVPDDLDNLDAAIWVLDDGQSMDVAGLQQLWSVATSKKRETPTANGRRQIGKFGVGKLATYLLANELTYVCKAADGVVRAVTMDYRRIDGTHTADALHIEKLPLEVRELDPSQLQSVLNTLTKGDKAADLIEQSVPKQKLPPDYENEYVAPDTAPGIEKGTWTLAILTSLKPMGRKLQDGWIKFILRSALPLGNSIQVTYNGESLSSSKLKIIVAREWVIGPDLGFDELSMPDGKTIKFAKHSSPYPHIVVEGLGPVSGRARLFEERISGGKSDEVATSNGFMVNVRGRVIKPEDPYFGIDNLSHSVWARFRATVRFDGLDEQLAVNRETVLEGEEVRIARAFLLKLFNEARRFYESQQAAGWPDAGDVLVEKWGRVPFEPLQRIVNSTSIGMRPEFVHVPAGMDLVEAKEKWEKETKDKPAEFIKDVRVESGSAEERLVAYDLSTRNVIVNANHPFAKEHAGTQEELHLLRDTALVELLTNAYMADIGIPEDQVAQVLAYRDRVYRLVAQVRRRSAPQIAQMLIGATDHVKGFERIVGDALDHIGFDVVRMGEPGKPEGVATARVTPTKGDQMVAYSFTYDAKSTGKGKVKTSNIGFAGLARHRKDFSATYTLVVAPDYETGALEKEAADNKVTPIRAADLAKIVMLTVSYGPLNLMDLRPLFDLYDPAHVTAWVDSLVADAVKPKQSVPLDVLIKALELLDDENPDRPDMLSCGSIAEKCRAILKDKSFPDRGAVARVIQGLAMSIPNVIAINGFDVILNAKPSSIKAALSAQLNKVAKDYRYGFTRDI